MYPSYIYTNINPKLINKLFTLLYIFRMFIYKFLLWKTPPSKGILFFIIDLPTYLECFKKITNTLFWITADLYLLGKSSADTRYNILVEMQLNQYLANNLKNWFVYLACNSTLGIQTTHTTVHFHTTVA